VIEFDRALARGDLREVVLVRAEPVIEPVQPAAEDRIVMHVRAAAEILDLQCLVAGT
jgi:hypothetical protein